MQDPLFGFEWNQLDAPTEIREGLFAVVAKTVDGRFHAVGTGFVVRALNDAALAISAGHVFAEIQNLQQRHEQRSHGTTPQEFSPPRRPIEVSLSGLAMVTGAEPSAVVCQVESLAFDEFGDVGVVHLRPQGLHAAMFPLREFLLEDEPPMVGQLVCVASYINLACHSDGPGHFQLQRQAILRVGKVLNVFPTGQRLCRGPCFETSIPIYSGMSGGPVFHYDTSGAVRVLGLVCSDLDLDGPTKDDRAIRGQSLMAQLPVKRVSGSSHGVQEVVISLVPNSLAGVFSGLGEIRMQTQ
jgi:Trypsin-like peptidase domain